MSGSNFCTNCGARLARAGRRTLLRGAHCEDCALRLGNKRVKPMVLVIIVALSAFALGRYLRRAPPPLIVYRAANSPLPDAPINPAAIVNGTVNNSEHNPITTSAAADDVVYLCGARTKKGTPCRRRVHFAGERCYQHKGMPAMVSLEKLIIKPDAAKK